MKGKTNTNWHIQYIGNCLNTSRTKEVRSFAKSNRFIQEKSQMYSLSRQSPDVFYQLPSDFQARSLSPRAYFRNSFQRDRVKSVGRDYFSFSAEKQDLREGRTRATTFGIGRQQVFNPNKNNLQLGPGSYDLKGSIQKKPFYMGRKIPIKIHDNQPNCATYTITRQSLQKLSTSKGKGVPKIKKEINPQNKYHKYDNKLPGPGSYAKRGFAEINTSSYRDNHNRKKHYTSFGIGQRMKSQRPSYIGPGSYNRFSQFGNNYTLRYH